ncbi:MAG TPA: hypothetical protein VF475_15340 [Sphingobium sp.]
MYTLRCEADRNLIVAEIHGFLTVEDVTAFSVEEQALVRSMGCASGDYLLMVITEEAVIQSQEVVAKFIDIVSNSPLKARRVAVVRGASLTRMQTQRILSIRNNAAIFVERPEAEAWLFQQDAVTAA